MMPANGQIAQLEEIAADLRKACQEQTGVDPAFAGRTPDSAFSQTRIDLRELNRIRNALTSAACTLSQQETRAADREGRISRLESSNGALMVDRDRGIAEAGQRATYAWEVAEAALAAAGLDTGELADLVAEHTRYGHYVDSLIDGERERLEAFRITLCGVFQALDGRDGLTAAQVGTLRRAIGRANNNACGR